MLKQGKHIISAVSKQLSATHALASVLRPVAVASYAKKPKTIDINSEFSGLKENEDYIIRTTDRDVEQVTDVLNKMQDQDNILDVKQTFREHAEISAAVEKGELPAEKLTEFEDTFAKKEPYMASWQTYNPEDVAVNDNVASYWYTVFDAIPADTPAPKRLIAQFSDWMAEAGMTERRALLKWLIDVKGRRDIVRRLQSSFITAKLKAATKTQSKQQHRVLDRIRDIRQDLALTAEEYLVNEIIVTRNTHKDIIIPALQQKMFSKVMLEEIKEAQKAFVRTDDAQEQYDGVLRKPKLPGIDVAGSVKFTSAQEILIRKFKQGWIRTHATWSPYRAEQNFVTQQQEVLNDLAKVSIGKTARLPFPPAAGERYGAKNAPKVPHVPNMYDPLDSRLIINNGESHTYDIRQGLEFAKQFASMEARAKFTEQYAGFPEYASATNDHFREQVFRGDDLAPDLAVTQPLDYLADQHYLDSFLGEFEEIVIRVKKTTNIRSTGRTPSYNAFVLVGCPEYKMVGYGFGTGATGTQALTKARKNTRANIRHFEFDECRIIERVEAKFGGTRVMFYPKIRGDLKAHPTLKKILEWLGVSCGSVKTVGNRHPVNMIYAFFKCLEKVRTRDDITKARGVPPRYLPAVKDVAERVNHRGIYVYN